MISITSLALALFLYCLLAVIVTLLNFKIALGVARALQSIGAPKGAIYRFWVAIVAAWPVWVGILTCYAMRRAWGALRSNG